ncbi:hypothetical protein PATA110616_22280 [Paenibacillus tarimensis]
MNLTLCKLPYTFFMPSELFGMLALALDHPFSMMTVICSSPSTRFETWIIPKRGMC